MRRASSVLHHSLGLVVLCLLAAVLIVACHALRDQPAFRLEHRAPGGLHAVIEGFAVKEGGTRVECTATGGTPEANAAFCDAFLHLYQPQGAPGLASPLKRQL
jgi:hypothetical protein